MGGGNLSFLARLLFSRLHARSQKFRALSPVLAAREPDSGEMEDLGIAGDADSGGGIASRELGFRVDAGNQTRGCYTPWVWFGPYT
jgi:hypothetical protein